MSVQAVFLKNLEAMSRSKVDYIRFRILTPAGIGTLINLEAGMLEAKCRFSASASAVYVLVQTWPYKLACHDLDAPHAVLLHREISDWGFVELADSRICITAIGFYMEKLCTESVELSAAIKTPANKWAKQMIS